MDGIFILISIFVAFGLFLLSTGFTLWRLVRSDQIDPPKSEQGCSEPQNW